MRGRRLEERESAHRGTPHTQLPLKISRLSELSIPIAIPRVVRSKDILLKWRKLNLKKNKEEQKEKAEIARPH